MLVILIFPPHRLLRLPEGRALAGLHDEAAAGAVEVLEGLAYYIITLSCIIVLYVYIYIYMYLSLSLYIYIYIYICVYIYIYIHSIYISISLE